MGKTNSSCRTRVRPGRRVRAAGATLLLVLGVLTVGAVASTTPASAAVPSVLSRISAGYGHTCGVTNAGAAMCWGTNSSGQVGSGGGLNSSKVPVQVTGLTSSVTAVSSGYQQSCAVVAGAAKCWGANTNGRLGDGTTTDRPTPVQVTGLTSGVTAVSTGTTHTCAVVSEAAWCWGNGANGRLGNGGTTSSSVPVPVVGLGSGVTAIAAGDLHTCAVQSGAVKCWGNNGSGRLGNGTTTQATSPVQVSGLVSGATVVTASASNTCAVVSGAARCWGGGGAGVLGTGGTSSSSTPVAVTGLSAGVSQIDIGEGFACAVASGGAWCWGANFAGQVGDETFTDRLAPVQVPALASQVRAISAGRAHACALVGSTARCWGDNGSGQRGDGTAGGTPTPRAVTGIASGAIDVATGDRHSCAAVSGGVQCWGEGFSGELGNGTTSNSKYAVPVSGLTDGVTAIDAGGGHTCAIVSGGVQCWGDNFYGQLGNGSTAYAVTTPVAVTGMESGVTAIAAGQDFTCAVRSGAGWCWGRNNQGQLGDGSTTGSLVPVPVSGLSAGVTDIGASGFAACAVVSGAAKCWGLGTNGVLGQGNTTSSTTPLQVSGLTAGVTDVSISSGTACAVVSGGARCWGTSPYGEIGNGSTATSFTPAQVTGLTTGVSAISSGGFSTCAIVSEAMRCWGSGVSGNLANGAYGSSLVPVLSLLTSGVTAISVNSYHMCAVRSGVPYCWGSDNGAVLGSFDLSVRTVLGGHIWFQNAAPVAAAQEVLAARGVATHILLAATDGDGEPLAYTVVGSPAKGTLDCNGIDGEDCLYTAGPGQTGSDSFTFKANDGDEDSNVATVSITISNQAPVADAVSVSAPRGVASEVVLTGSDPNSDPFTFAKASDPSKGTASCTAAGVCSYTADPGTTGTDSFTFTTSDGELTSAAGTVTITITNQAPTANDHTLDAGRGVATPVALSGADPNGDPLTYEIVTPPSKGSLSCVPADSATCTYTSTASETGTDSFTYRSSDGALNSPPATVAITLVNAGPTANDQSLEAPRGVATPITLSGADGDGDALAFDVTDGPAKGTLTCNEETGASCTYTAGVGQTGTDSFTFTATDGPDTSAPGTVTISITNQAPVANNQTVAGNAPTTETPITLTGSDLNGDALTFAPTSSPSKGSLNCEAEACRYTAAAGKTGSDAFTFTATDSGGLVHTGTITITLDATTPGVFVGGVDFVEPESGNATYRSPFIPVTLTTASASPVTVWYHTVDGTAVADGLTGDYREWGTVASPRSITIPAGQTTGYIQPPVLDDALVEGTESFRVVISSTSGGAAYRGDSTTTVRIIDADTISDGRPILSVLDVEQNEGNAGTRTIGFRAVLSKASPTPVKLTCTPTSGTALAGSDFKAGPKTVTINAGSLSTTIDVLGYTNTVAQPDREFTLLCVLVGTPDIAVYDATATSTVIDED